MIIEFDTSKTLDELEGTKTGEPEYKSSLVVEAHRLRKTPLIDWTDRNLTRMVFQKMSLNYLVPLAINRLGTTNKLTQRIEDEVF